MERETVIDFTNKDPIATIYTKDFALLRRLDKLMQKNDEMKIVSYGKTWRVYSLPKKHMKLVFKGEEE